MSPQNEELTPEPKRAAIFDFEEGEISEEEILQDNTDTTDYVKTQKKRNFLKTFSIAIMGFAIIGAAIYGFTYLLNNDANSHLEPPTQNPIPSETSVTPLPPVQPTIQTNNNPITDSFPGAPRVVEGEEVATINAEQNTITTTKGEITVTITNATLAPAETECKVTTPVQFCLVGTATYSDELVTDIYFQKDAARSRIFENHENFQKHDIPGTSTAGSMNITLVGDQTVLATVGKNSSGYMFVFSEKNPTQENIETVVESITFT